MRSTQIRWAAAVLSCLAGAAMVMAPGGALAASHHHSPTKKHHSKVTHPNGLFIGTRNGKSTKVENFGTPSAFVRDDNGGEHVVTTEPSKSDPNKGHIVYLTRDAGSSKWKSHAIPGSRSLNGDVQVEAHMSQGDRRIFAVFYECDGVFAADAPVGAARLPEPTKIVSEDECADPPATSASPPVQTAGTLYSRTIDVLLPDPAQGGADAIYSGTPTGGFTPGTAVPTTDDFTPVQIAADPDYGNLVVVGTGSDGTNEGIYVVTQRRFEDTWTGPTLVASLNSPTSDYKIQAIQTFARHTYIGLSKPVKSGTHPAHTLFLVRGQPSGQWTGSVPLPHSNGHDQNLRLVVNTGTRHLHAVWTRVTPGSKKKKSGIMHEAQNASGWLKPTFITHWYRDVATQIGLNSAGHPYIGFNQR